MPLSDRRRSLHVESLPTEQRRSDPCPVEHENPNENWEPSSEFTDDLRNLAEQVAEYDLRVSILLWDALEILEETKRPDE